MSEEPPLRPDQWAQIEGTSVRYVEWPGPGCGPTYVLVHGLGGSLVNWDALAPLLAEHGRVLALDLSGFGHTRVSDPRRARVAENRELLSGFMKALELPPVVLVGNSMGGTICALQAAAEPETVAELVLINPALPGDPRHRPKPMVLAVFGAYLVPPLGRRMLSAHAARLTAEQSVRETFNLVTRDRKKVPAWLMERHVRMQIDRQEYAKEASETLLVAAKSVVATVLNRPRYARALREVRCPVLLLHGAHDRLVSVGSARVEAKRHPRWTYAEGRDLGHCPMFEDPDWVRDHMLAFASDVAAK